VPANGRQSRSTPSLGLRLARIEPHIEAAPVASHWRQAMLHSLALVVVWAGLLWALFYAGEPHGDLFPRK
jgi:hypothetical protein